MKSNIWKPKVTVCGQEKDERNYVPKGSVKPGDVTVFKNEDDFQQVGDRWSRRPLLPNAQKKIAQKLSAKSRRK